jgi:hypothetical protein
MKRTSRRPTCRLCTGVTDHRRRRVEAITSVRCALPDIAIRPGSSLGLHATPPVRSKRGALHLPSFPALICRCLVPPPLRSRRFRSFVIQRGRLAGLHRALKNRTDRGVLTERGVEICYRLFGLDRSPMAVAYLVGMTYKSPSSRFKAWQKVGGMHRRKLELEAWPSFLRSKAVTDKCRR